MKKIMLSVLFLLAGLMIGGCIQYKLDKKLVDRNEFLESANAMKSDLISAYEVYYDAVEQQNDSLRDEMRETIKRIYAHEM